MTIRSMIQAGIGSLRRPGRLLLHGAVVAAVAGCASTQPAPKQPTLREDFLEYRQLIVQAMSLMDASLRSLDDLSVQANRNPGPAYAAFAKAVQHLEVDSMRMRAHTQAMRARGDAYFEHWQEYLGTVKNEEVRKLAEEHRAQLKQNFDQVQQAAQQVREVFRPFLSDLQKLRAVLEAEPSLAHIDGQRDLILAAGDKGRQVQQGLDRILAGMNSMTDLLRPPATGGKH